MYIRFCLHFGLQNIDPSTSTILMYGEFLARTFQSPKTIRNYISGVRLMHKYLDIHLAALYSFELTLLLRFMDINMQHIPNQRLPINVTMLNKMVNACDSLNAIGKVLKCALLLGFYGFLRQYNLAQTPPQHSIPHDIPVG